MLFENQARWQVEQRLKRGKMKAEWEPIVAVQDRWPAERAAHSEQRTVGLGSNIYSMVHQVCFCCDAQELDRFLDPLCSKVNSHGQRLPCSRPDHVQCAISLLDTWSNHQNLTLRQMVIRGPSKLAAGLSTESNPCIQYFNLIHKRCPRFMGPNDLWPVVVITLIEVYTQHPQQPLWVYAHRLKTNSR